VQLLSKFIGREQMGDGRGILTGGDQVCKIGRILLARTAGIVAGRISR